MWHVSVASQFILPIQMYEKQAREALKGVGDADLGEWKGKAEIAYHLRRRLSVKEQEKIGSAIDIRGTDEEKIRLERLANIL